MAGFWLCCLLLTGVIVFAGSKHCQENRRLQERRGGQEEASRVNSMGPSFNSFRDWLEQSNIYFWVGVQRGWILLRVSNPSDLYKNIVRAWNSVWICGIYYTKCNWIIYCIQQVLLESPGFMGLSADLYVCTGYHLNIKFQDKSCSLISTFSTHLCLPNRLLRSS